MSCVDLKVLISNQADYGGERVGEVGSEKALDQITSFYENTSETRQDKIMKIDAAREKINKSAILPSLRKPKTIVSSPNHQIKLRKPSTRSLEPHNINPNTRRQLQKKDTLFITKNSAICQAKNSQTSSVLTTSKLNKVRQPLIA